MSDLLSTMPPHIFSDKDCFPMGVTYPLSLVNKHFYQLLTSHDQYINYWQKIVTSSDFLYAEARFSCLFRRNKDHNFTLLELEVLDLKDRKVVKAASSDMRTNFETIRAICTRLTRAIEAAFYAQTGRETRSFFYQEDLENAHKSLYRMALKDYNDIHKPGASIDTLSLSPFLKAIMEERLPLDVVIYLIGLQTSLLTVKTHSDYLFFNFKSTALLIFTSDSVLNHLFFQESPHEILIILLLLLELIFVTSNPGTNIPFKQIVRDSTTTHLSIIEHLHKNHSFSFREIIILLEWNLSNQPHTLSFHYFLNFILALNNGYISSTKIRSKINKRAPTSFQHFTDEYYYCLQQDLINPKEQIALRNHILNNSLSKHHPHPLSPLYTEFLMNFKNQDEMKDPLYPHIRNILDSFLDAFLLRPHEPDAENNRPPGLLTYADTIPFQWHTRGDLTLESLCAFYWRIKEILQSVIQGTPLFQNKDAFVTHFMMKKKVLYTFMSSIMSTFVEQHREDADAFHSFHQTTHAFIKMFESALSVLFTSDLTRHFAQTYLSTTPLKSNIDFKDLTDHQRVTAHIAPLLFTRHHPFPGRATMTLPSFNAVLDTLSGLVDSFISDAVPKLQHFVNYQTDIIRLTTSLFVQQYHNYLFYYFYILEHDSLEIVHSIHRTFMESINDDSFFNFYVTYIIYLHKHLGIQKMLDVGSTRLHFLLITFLKLLYCLRARKIEAQHFEEIVTLLDMHRKNTITKQFTDFETVIYDFFSEQLFLDLFHDRKKSADWVNHHINMINVIFPILSEETISDMELDDFPLEEEFQE
jgi:hypothetical protein